MGLGAYLCWAADQDAAAAVLRVLLAAGLDPCRGGALHHAGEPTVTGLSRSHPVHSQH